MVSDTVVSSPLGGRVAALALVACLSGCSGPTHASTPQDSGAGASTVAAPERAVARIPTMDRAAFLTGYDDEPQKTRLWDLFRAAERSAKDFASSPDRFVVLQRADLGNDGAKWLPRGVIQLSPNTDPGTLFHEIFHTAFHKSAFHAGDDERWGEGFCDAFRFMTERELLSGPPSAWEKKIDGYTSMSFDEVMAKSGDQAHDKKYGYPASLIVKKTDRTTKGLRALWYQLAALRETRGTDVLDGFFGFEMKVGRPIGG